MGSVELFPRKAPVQTIAEVWRRARLGSEGGVRVREMRLDDYAAFHSLQRQANPASQVTSLRQFESRRQAFAAGQLVALCDNQVVGAASALQVRWDVDRVGSTWSDMTGEGFFTNHEASAQTLYSAQLLLAEGLRRQAAARALVQAQRRLCRRLNLRRLVTTAALEGFGEVEDVMSAERFCMRVVAGDLPGATLHLQLSLGFQYCGVLHGYIPEEADSRGHSALLAWLNPLHALPGPPAFAISTRARKCA